MKNEAVDEAQGNSLCPWCHAIPVCYDNNSWAEIEHKKDCYLRRVQDDATGKGKFLITDLKAWNTRVPPTQPSATARELAEKIVTNVGNRADCLSLAAVEDVASIVTPYITRSGVPPTPSSSTPLLRKIVEICDDGSAAEFGDALERLRAIRGLIIGESV